MTSERIKKQLETLPAATGVYLMKDASSEILYVGKAKSLKNRVKSYFNKELHSPKIEVMVTKVHHIDFITTDNEVEALVLEDALVKRHQPRYNTLLKDDKKFPWIEITNEDYPRILVTRKPVSRAKRGKSKYFGPYVNSKALYSTIEFLKKVFPLKQCRMPVYRNKPCMNYHIHRCLAPCQQMVTSDEYKHVLNQVELFLTGKQIKLLEKLEDSMRKASIDLEYEKAAKYRDTIKSIKHVIETQKVVSDDITEEKDIFAFASDSFMLSLVLFKIREGKLVYKESFDLTINELDTSEETFWAFFEHYYTTIQGDQIAKDIIVPYASEDVEIVAGLLSTKKHQKVKIIVPKARKNFELLKMAEKNAEISLTSYKQQQLRSMQNKWNEVGAFLQTSLNLSRFPETIECFDISHLSGTDTVASMVVFYQGKQKKSDYRKFKINTTEGNIDDFAAMREVITRRYSRLKKENKRFPDLVIVDGGKGQLSSALNALKEIKIVDLPVVSLAKRYEEVYMPGRILPLLLDKDSAALQLFQQIRDEAHRFAITYQRNLRSKRMTRSALDSISHIGKKRKTILLKHFGSVEKILNADITELSGVKGISISLAEHIYNELRQLKTG